MTLAANPVIPLKRLAAVMPSNVDKHSVDGEQQVSLCNYVDVYKNERITDALNFMEATATEAQVSRFTLQAHDVIVTKDSEEPTDIGIPAYVPSSLPGVVCGYHLAVLRPSDERLYGGYLHWALQSAEVKAYYSTAATCISRYALGIGDLGMTPIHVPSRTEQVRIANFLDEQTARIDALIAEKERLTSALAELRTARIWSAVTGQGAPSRQTVPESPWSPSIPSHWKVTPVGRFARLQRGFDLPEEERWPGSVPVMSGGGISGWHSNARVKGPGVVTGRYGTIGILHYVEEDYWPLNTSLFVDDFFGNNEKYVYYVLSFLPWDMLGGKSAVPGVNRNDVHPLLVGAPPRVEQDAIVASLDTEFAQLSALSEHVQAHIARLREYRSSLISAAVTGQLDLSTFKKAVQ